MGRINSERKIHFNYTKMIVDNWKEQSDEMKLFCKLIGRYCGYSGMNIFYLFFWIYWIHRISGKEIKAYERKEF